MTESNFFHSTLRILPTKKKSLSEQSFISTESYFVSNEDEMFEDTALMCLPANNKFRKFVQKVVGKKAFQIVINVVIILNCIFLIFETIDSLKEVNYYSNMIFISIFTLECLMKIVAYGFILGEHSYLRDPWNWLDFIVVITGIINFVPFITADLRALRTFRLIRSFKTITFLPNMKLFIETLVDSLLDLGTVLLLLVFFLMIFAILGLSLWNERFGYLCRSSQIPANGSLPIDPLYSKHLCGGENTCGGRPEYCLSATEISKSRLFLFSHAYDYPNEIAVKEFNYGLTNFNNILNSLFVIVIVTTMQGWSDIMFMLMDGHNYFISAIYFVLCVIINYYFIFNLLVAVLIYNFSRARTRDLKLNIEASRGAKGRKKSFIQVNVSLQNLGEEASRKKYRNKYEPLIKKTRDKAEVEKLLNKIYRFRRFSCFKRVKRLSVYHKKYFFGYLCYYVIQQPIFQLFFHTLIVFNGIIFSLDRVDISQTEKELIQTCNYIFVACFACEQFLTINGLGFRNFLKNRLACLGFFIVSSSIIELSLKSYGIVFNNSTASLISSFRMLRLLRFLTFFRGWQDFQIILESIFAAIARMSDFILLFLVFLYMYALLGYSFFFDSMKYKGDSYRFTANEPSTPLNFDNFPRSLISVFAIIIGDHWQGLFYDCFRSDKNHFLVTIIYFLTLVVFGHITLMNIFLAYIIDSFENAKQHIEKNVNVRNYIYELMFLHNERTQESQEPNLFGLLRKNKLDFIENKVILKYVMNKYTGNLNSVVDEKKRHKVREPKIKEMQLIWKKSKYDLDKEEFYDFGLCYKQKRHRKEGEKNKSMNHIQFKEKFNREYIIQQEDICQFLKRTESDFCMSSINNFSYRKLLNKDDHIKHELEETDISVKERNKADEKKETTLTLPTVNLRATHKGNSKEPNEIKQPQKRLLTYMKESSLFVFHKDCKARLLIKLIVKSQLFIYIIFTLILIGCICLCLTTPYVDLNSGGGKALRIIDDITNYAFIIEAVLRIIANGLLFEPNAYFKSVFNIIDFGCVIISILDFFDLVHKYQFIRTLRALRALKPIQLIIRSDNLSLMASCLIHSIPAITSLVIYSAILILLFGVVGVGLLKGELYYYCTIPMIKSKAACLKAGGNWFYYPDNYSNLLYSLKSNFEVMSTENWANLMQFAVRQKDESIFVYLFFIFNLIIGHVFIINLLAALVIQKFKSLKSIRNHYFLLNKAEKEWVHVQKMLSVFHPTPRPSVDTSSESMKKLTLLVESASFEKVIGLFVLLSGVLLIIQHSGASHTLNMTLELLNVSFIFLFNIEIVLQLIVYGKGYFYSIWNKCDFFIIIICDVFGVLYVLSFSDIIYMKEISVIPLVLRLFRILKALRVLSTFGKLRALIDSSLFYLLPSIGNVGIIIFIFILIYANVGMNVFGTVPYRKHITPNNSFRNFLSSSLLLFQAITKENWNSVMNEVAYHDCRDPNSEAYQEDYYCVTYNVTCNDEEDLNLTALNDLGMHSCGNNFSYVYFISFIIIGPMFMMNLCIVMVIEGFSESMSENESLLPQDYLQKFVRVWMNYDPEYKKLITPYEFILLLKELQPPLGLNYDGMSIVDLLPQFRDRSEYFTFIDLLAQIKWERQEVKRVNTIKMLNGSKYVNRIKLMPQKYKFKNYYLSRNKKFHTTDTEVFKIIEKLEIIASEEASFHKNKFSYLFTTENRANQAEESELYIHFVEACIAISRYAVSKTQNIALKKLRRIIVTDYTKSMWAKQYDKEVVDKLFPQSDISEDNKLSRKLAGKMMLRAHKFYKKPFNERSKHKRMSLYVPETKEVISFKKSDKSVLDISVQTKHNKLIEGVSLNNELVPVKSCFTFKSSTCLIDYKNKVFFDKPKAKTFKTKVMELFKGNDDKKKSEEKEDASASGNVE